MSQHQRPGPTAGMRHVALFVDRFEACLDFYTRVMGMDVEWHPDEDNVYLCSGNDNLALHRNPEAGTGPTSSQRLDHIGFIIDEMDDVDRWYEFLKAQEATLLTRPRTHRDGARSFYFEDPAGTKVQIIFHPPLSTGGK